MTKSLITLMGDRRSFNYGWIIVGISFITLSLSYGIWYSFSVFFVALLKEFNWSRSLTAGTFSLFVILHAAIGPFIGSLVDRFSPRRIFILGSLFLGIGLALCSSIHSLWQFYIFFGILTGIGVGSLGWVPNTTIIQQWFKEKRGLAMGIISSGVGTGILIHVPLTQHLIDRVGWRMAYRIIAVFIPLMIICLAILFLKKPSQRISIYKEHEISKTDIKDPPIGDKEWVSKSWSIGQAVATKQFWILSLSFFLASFIMQSILVHHVAFFVDEGLGTLLASYIVGFIGLVSIVGKILWGALSDKIGREVTYTVGITCLICGIILLIIFPIFPYRSIPYFYAFFFGMGYAVMTVLPPLITADFFEGQSYGSIFGTLFCINGVGGASGAWFAGFLHDQIGSYLPVLFILIVCALISCLNIWQAAPRKIKTVPG
jgi:MFS family permease